MGRPKKEKFTEVAPEEPKEEINPDDYIKDDIDDLPVENNFEIPRENKFACKFGDGFIGKSEGSLALHYLNVHRHVEGKTKQGQATLERAIRKNDERPTVKDKVTYKGDGTKETALNVAKVMEFDAELLAMIQMMLNSGIAPDFKSLIKQAVYEKAYKTNINLGGENMINQNDPDDPSKFLEKMQKIKMKQDMMKAFNSEGKESSIDDIDFSSMIKMMEQKYKMDMLRSSMDGGGGTGNIQQMFMQMMMTQMMKSMFDPKPAGPSPEVIAMQTQLQALQSEILRAQQEAKDEKFKQLMTQAVESKRDQKDGFQDFLLAMKKVEMESKQKENELMGIIKQKDEESKAMEMEKFRSEVMGQIQELSKKNLGSFGDAFQEKMQKKILEKLDLDKLMDEKKESGWDKVKDILGTVMEHAGPILEPIGQAMAQKMAGPPPQPVVRPMVSPEMLQRMNQSRMPQQLPEQLPPQQQAPVNSPPVDGETPKEMYYEDAEEMAQYENPQRV